MINEGSLQRELDLTEGRSTGIPKILKVMASNGSPAPLFGTDDERASFVVRLPVHPLAKQPTTDVTVEIAALRVINQGCSVPHDAALSRRDNFRQWLLPAVFDAAVRSIN